MKSIVLYLHVHQPYRVRNYSVFDISNRHNYFTSEEPSLNNRSILEKVVNKSYLPTNALLLKLLKKYPQFKISLSITGTLIEQLQDWAPDALQTFIDLTRTGRCEIVAETYYHSMAFFFSRAEFEAQVQQHRKLIEKLFHQTPTVFRNTELAYSNELATWAEEKGYSGILSEGWDPILQWRSPNFVYRPVGTKNIRLLLKNYQLSDDIAFRFSNHAHLPNGRLDAATFVHWIHQIPNFTNIDLFMDYETFGEHHWQESGIYQFLEALPSEWLKQEGYDFRTVTEMCNEKPVDEVDMPHVVTWADQHRDLSAWMGNAMQKEALSAVYSLENAVNAQNDQEIVRDWRRLQTSDHFYYMFTSNHNDQDVHAYFSPYSNPYDAYLNFMNVWRDLSYRLEESQNE